MNTTQTPERIHFVTWYQCDCKHKSFEAFTHEGRGHRVMRYATPDTSLTYIAAWMMDRLTKNGAR
jgi:hypothetical protein